MKTITPNGKRLSSFRFDIDGVLAGESYFKKLYKNKQENDFLDEEKVQKLNSLDLRAAITEQARGSAERTMSGEARDSDAPKGQPQEPNGSTGQ